MIGVDVVLLTAGPDLGGQRELRRWYQLAVETAVEWTAASVHPRRNLAERVTGKYFPVMSS